MVRSHRNGRGNKNDKLTLRRLMPFSSTSPHPLRARQNASDTQPHAKPTRTWWTCPLPMVLLSTAHGKGLKMFDALERVLKGLKPVSRGPLPSALIEISLSRFYYLGMDAASVVQRGVAHQNNPGVTDKPPYSSWQ